MKEEKVNEKTDFHRYELTLKIDKLYQDMLATCENAVLEMRTLEKKIQEEENEPPAELIEGLEFVLETRQQIKYQLGLEQPEHEKKVRKVFSILSSFLFYTFLVLVVLGFSFFRGGDDAPPSSIAGYSFMTVLSGSMQRDIPQGALIITRSVDDPQSIEIGDDITYITQNGMTVTHRVVDIEENFGGSGKRGFQTQGIENSHPDEEIVYEPNVIGRVIFVNLLMGQIIQFIQQSIIFVIVFIVLLICFIAVMKRYFQAGKMKTRY